MPLPPLPKEIYRATEAELLRFQTINERDKEKYKKTGIDLNVDDIIQNHQECIPPVLKIVDIIEKTTDEYVILPNTANDLSVFEKKFKKHPFYIVAIEAPELSHAFSQTINDITQEYRLKKSRTVTELRKKTLDYSREIAQGNAIDFYKELQHNIEDVQSQGVTNTRNIVVELNKRGIKTRQGEEWKIHNLYHAQKQIEKYSNS